MGIMSALTLLVGLTGLYAVKASHDTLKNSHEERSLGLYKLASMDKLLLANRHAILAALADSSAEKLHASADAMERDKRAIDQLWLEFASLPMTQDARKKADELSSARVSFDHAVTVPAIQAMHNANAASLREISQFADKFAGPVVKAIDSLRTLQLDALNQEFSSAEAAYARVSNLMWGAITLGLVLAAALAYFLIHVIYRQLGGEPAYAAQIARQIADGDHGVSITPDVHDEASLLASLQQLQSSLEKIGKEVHLHTGSISRTSVQIQSNNMLLSSRMDQQAASHRQITSATKDLITGIRDSAGQVRQAMQIADEAGECAIKKAQASSAAMTAMTQLRDAWTRIGDNVQVIDELAFQIDTVALKSALENDVTVDTDTNAGPGYATIAPEVRGLAQGVACAVHEINKLLHESREGLDQANKQISLGNVDTEKMLVALQNANSLLAGVDVASKKQEANIRHIRHAVSDLEYASRKDAILLGTSATAAKLMEQHAKYLSHLSNEFRPGPVNKTKLPLQVVGTEVTEQVAAKRPNLRIVRP